MMNLQSTRSQRKCVTPRRERPGAALQKGPVPIENVLDDASQFPQLPNGLNLLPRGRKARRSHGAWDEQGMPTRTRSLSRASLEQTSQQGSSHADEQQKQGCRARAYSHDAGVDALKEKAEATTPRSSLKKPRDSMASDVGVGGNAALAKLQKEMQEKMLEMVALMGQSQVGMQLNQMLATLPSESEAKGPAIRNERETKPTRKPCADGAAEEVEVVRPRRLSNPGTNALEPPSGVSWEYPLTKNEKKARVVLISEVEIDSLQDENAALQEELSRLSVDFQK